MDQPAAELVPAGQHHAAQPARSIPRTFVDAGYWFDEAVTCPTARRRPHRHPGEQSRPSFEPQGDDDTITSARAGLLVDDPPVDPYDDDGEAAAAAASRRAPAHDATVQTGENRCDPLPPSLQDHPAHD